jgi:FixJ family two-component response regulator
MKAVTDRTANGAIGTLPAPGVATGLPVVFVVDDDISVRESLEALIRHAGWQPEVFASTEAFLAHPRMTQPSCLILDVSLPNSGDLALHGRIGVPVIFITGHGDIPMTVQAMKAGATEFMTKPFSDEAVLSAIGFAIARSEMELRSHAELQALRNRYVLLSQREQQVMALVVAGLLNKQIGGELGISEITVKAHRGRVMRKMQATSLANLVNMAAGLQVDTQQ